MPTAAFMTDAPRVAGSEVWLRDLLPLLGRHGVQASLFLPRRAALTTLAQAFADTDVTLHWYDQLDELPALTRRYDLRVVQAWEPVTYARLLPRLTAPRLVVSHDQLDYHYPAPLRALYRQIYRVTKASRLAAADGVITVSDWGAAFLRGQMQLRNVWGMTNGVDPVKFQPASPQRRAELRHQLEFRRFTVLVPGRFTLEKNQLLGVLAARHAPQLDFVFVGDMDSGFGQLARALKTRLGLANVRLLGRRWDMPDLYRAADALLQPTLAENQSLVTLEAMSSGLPIVTSDIPAQTELVRDGVDGLCVPADPALVACALIALSRHPQRASAFGLSARQRILERHTAQQSAARLAELLKAPCSGSFVI